MSFQVFLNGLLTLNCLLVGLLYLRDRIGVILLFLGNLPVKVGVELCNQSLVLRIDLLDLFRMFGFEFLELLSRGRLQGGLELSNLVLVRDLEELDFLFILLPQLLGRL